MDNMINSVIGFLLCKHTVWMGCLIIGVISVAVALFTPLKKFGKIYVIFLVGVTGIYVWLTVLNLTYLLHPNNINSNNEILKAFIDFVSTVELPILFLLIDKVFLNNKDKNKDKDIEKQPQQDTSNIKSGTQATKDIVETIEKLQSDIKKIKSKIDNTLQQTIKINDNLTTIETKLDELANLAKLEERAGSTTPENKTTKGNSSNQ